ncbi:MAG: hypothetical protein AUI10_00735 [Actinobacteria bacterium 13_2_20CM_2_72_6]|nr:MAG: hypothetical protein AUI10_00735 [Actinobacteria bacterium 13_2_20CM_2_72_6]
MISNHAVYQILATEAALLALTVVACLGHGARLAWLRRADPPRLARAQETLAALLVAETGGPVPVNDLPRLPRRLRRQLLTDLSRSLRGRHRDRIGELATMLGVAGQARRWARSRWWWRRLYGAHLLRQLAVEDPILVRLLDDRHPAVRCQAILWAGDHADTILAERLMTLLTDPSALCRYTAVDALLRTGPALPPRLAEHLTNGRDPSLSTLLEIAAARPDHRYLPAALWLSGSRRARIRLRAARLLGAVGGDAATDRLVRLLDDADAGVRAAAADSLGNLQHWPAASHVARLLRDPAWEVRRASGEALLAFGAPGRLLLRRHAHDEDRFAADMAQRILRTAELRPAGAAR